MPQLIFFALVGLIAYIGYRHFLREAERVTAKVRRAVKQAATGTSGTLGPPSRWKKPGASSTSKGWPPILPDSKRAGSPSNLSQRCTSRARPIAFMTPG